MPSPLGYFDFAPASNLTRNSFRLAATYRPQEPPFASPPNGWYFVVDITLGPRHGGPGLWTPAPLFADLSDPCLGQRPDNRVLLASWQFVGQQQTVIHVGDLVPFLAPDVEYLLRFSLFDDNDVLVDEYTTPDPITTPNLPDQTVCLTTGETPDGATARIGATDGAWNYLGGAACFDDDVTVEWGLPGAGFPNSITVPANSGTPGVDLVGLDPNQTYEYRMSGASKFGETWGPSLSCEFTTEHAEATCGFAFQNVRPTTAEVLATAAPTVLEPAWETRLVWGDSQGSWPNVVGPTGVPQSEIANLTDLLPSTTYWFRAEIINTNDGDRLLGWSDECEVTTRALAPPFGNPVECVTADITKYEARAVGISANLPSTLALRLTGPNGQTIDGAPGDESPELLLTGLLPDTDYTFTVEAFRVSDGALVPAAGNGSSTCPFRTLANIPPTVSDLDDQTSEVGDEACDDFTVADGDGTVVSVSASTGTLTDLGGGNWRICFTPTAIGTTPITITATDDNGATGTGIINFTGTPNPLPPDTFDPTPCDPIAPCEPWCSIPDPADPATENPAWCCDLVDLADDEHRKAAVWAQTVASSVLFRLSGSLFNGCCTVEEFLCLDADPCGCPKVVAGVGGVVPVSNRDGTWQNVRCCNGGSCGGCDCDGVARILLPHQPVTGIEQINLNGVDLDVTNPDPALRDVVLHNGYVYFRGMTMEELVACFDPTASPQRGLYVRWRFGQAPPPEGVNAACNLACELVKACLGKQCQLPQRVSSVSRQGVSWTVLDPMEFLEKGKTGIYAVDLFLGIYGGQEPSTVVFVEDTGPVDFSSRPRLRW